MSDDRARDVIARKLFADYDAQYGGSTVEAFYAQADSILAALAEAGISLGTWEPIETAPRDGTRLLLWHEDGFAVSGQWYNDPGIDTPNAYEPAWAWWVADDDVVLWDQGDTPTHWLRLPAPTRPTTDRRTGWMSKKKQPEPKPQLVRVVIERSNAGEWERAYTSLTFLAPETADLAEAAEAARAALTKPGD